MRTIKLMTGAVVVCSLVIVGGVITLAVKAVLFPFPGAKDYLSHWAVNKVTQFLDKHLGHLHEDEEFEVFFFKANEEPVVLTGDFALWDKEYHA